MKSGAVLLAPQARPATAVAASSRTQISGRPYVRLISWARAGHFAVRRHDLDKTLELSNHLARLVFNLDPRQDGRQAEINGVDVWLAFPVVNLNGSAYISQCDVDKTLTPVVSPPTDAPRDRIRTICLDPGHGGKDPGNQSGGHDEKQFTLLLARELRDRLTRAGYQVFLTRSKDAYVPLDTRTDVARNHKADLFVSLHFNSAGAQHRDVKGAEVYCLTPAGAFSTNSGGEGDSRACDGNRNDARNMLLAYEVEKCITRALPVEDRGVKRARYQVLREATMPAILIESGFMSNPAESKRIYDDAYRRRLAQAIADGIRAYDHEVRS
jgi:N-acetylmuramoyl-L-alanine amidase